MVMVYIMEINQMKGEREKTDYFYYLPKKYAMTTEQIGDTWITKTCYSSYWFPFSNHEAIQLLLRGLLFFNKPQKIWHTTWLLKDVYF